MAHPSIRHVITKQVRMDRKGGGEGMMHCWSWCWLFLLLEVDHLVYEVFHYPFDVLRPDSDSWLAMVLIVLRHACWQERGMEVRTLVVYSHVK
jgi:hypothetical protein